MHSNYEYHYYKASVAMAMNNTNIATYNILEDDPINLS